MTSNHHWIFNINDDIVREKCQQIINNNLRLNTTVDALVEAFKKIRDNLKETAIGHYTNHAIYSKVAVTRRSIASIFYLSLCNCIDFYVSLINAINQGYDLCKIILKLINIDDLEGFLICPKNNEILQIYQDLQSYYGFNITELPLFTQIFNYDEDEQLETTWVIHCDHTNCLVTPLISQGKLTKAALK